MGMVDQLEIIQGCDPLLKNTDAVICLRSTKTSAGEKMVRGRPPTGRGRAP